MPPRERRERVGRCGGPGTRMAGVAVLAALAVTAMTPAAHGAARLAVRFAAAMKSMPKKAAPGALSMPTATPFGGTAAVGALFSTTSSGGLGTHFCTASVVASPGKDLAVTAAHCVAGHSGGISFVPGYRAGSAPYGIWTVSKVIVDQAWTSSASIDDDVAFLVIGPAQGGVRIQDETGAEKLGIGNLGSLPVQVIGYPDELNGPVICHGRTSVPLPHQLEFDCGRYTVGTSGGPFLMDVQPGTGTGTVIGVIGGYQQGGDLPQISYAAEFGPNIAQLFRTAVRQGSSRAA